MTWYDLACGACCQWLLRAFFLVHILSGVPVRCCARIHQLLFVRFLGTYASGGVGAVRYHAQGQPEIVRPYRRHAGHPMGSIAQSFAVEGGLYTGLSAWGRRRDPQGQIFRLVRMVRLLFPPLGTPHR